MGIGQPVNAAKSVNHLLYWMNAVDVATISGEQQHVVDQVLNTTGSYVASRSTLKTTLRKLVIKIHARSFTKVVSPGMPFIFFSISVASFLVGEGVTAPSSFTLVSSGLSFTADASSKRHGGAMGGRVLHSPLM